MSTATGISFRCAYCGAMLYGSTEAHWCPQMNPNYTPPLSPSPVVQVVSSDEMDERIASALERIAFALEMGARAEDEAAS